MHLKEDCAQKIIEQYGFRRTAWVLSNTLQQKEWDGRFSPQNKEWARKTFISEEGRRTDYLVESHPAVLNGLTTSAETDESEELLSANRSACGKTPPERWNTQDRMNSSRRSKRLSR